MVNKMITSSKWFIRSGWGVYLLWHVIFIIVAFAILLPFITLPIINSVRIGSAPYQYGVYASLMTIIPLLSIIVVWWKFRKNVVTALQLFYGVEIPLLLLLLLRIVLFRDTPFSAQLVLTNITLGIVGYFCMLWYKDIPKSSLGRALDGILSTIIMLVGTYLGVLLGIHFLPFVFLLFAELWQAIINFEFSSLIDLITTIITNPLIGISILLLTVTIFFFLVTPLTLLLFYWHQFVKRIRAYSRCRLMVIVFSVLFIEGLLFTMSYNQPQHKAFSLTQNLPKSSIEQETLLSQKETIRDGLLNAYLAPYRYVSTTDSSRSLKSLYSDSLWSGSHIPDYAQTFFNALAAPFLYQGKNFSKEQALATDRYQEFFDSPIEKAEKQSILSAVKATWENEQNEAGLMNAASHYVLLKNQAINIEEHGDTATITITQVLENQTFQQQEVVFHFSLPEDVSVTGVWMSDDIDYPEKFPHVVSPRGAAQSVYKSEVNRRVDPALLEQVGPVQYRLRAFPIPARVANYEKGRSRYSNSFHDFSVSPALIRFQYVVSVDAKSNWPMPKLLEKRNIYWNETTKRSHNVEVAEAWLPETVEALKPEVTQKHIALISDKQVIAVPRTKQAISRPPSSALPIAVIVDGSYSMNMVRDQVDQQLNWLDQSSLSFDLFFCQDTCESIDENDLNQKTLFGNSQTSHHLSQWQTITAEKNKPYSSIYVLTDTGSYELLPEKTEELKAVQQPLWLIHLHKELPYAYSDEILDWINDSQGGIASNLEEAVKLSWWNERIGERTENGVFMGVTTRYFWFLQDNVSNVSEKEQPFSPIAASKLIQYLAATKEKSLSELDQLHDIAKQYDIVTFFSSMLVLVEDRQRQLLKDAESSKDRFDREIETGSETLGTPTDAFAVPGVPEPEEWALLIIVTCLLCFVYRRKIKEYYPFYLPTT